MKTGKKVMILLLIFVAAVIVYFIHPVGKKEEHGITEYTAMEKAKFPVLYATMGHREMAPVFGQTEERGVTADRGSLIVLPEDRKLKVRFAGTTKIQELRYEIRSLDTENLIERTQVTSLDAAINGDSENAVSAELLIQNLLETGKEYLLGVCVVFMTIERNGIRIVLRSMRSKGYNQKHILLVGYSSAAEGFIDRVNKNPEWGYTIRGIIDDTKERGSEYKGVKVIGCIEDLDYILEQNSLDEIAVTLSLSEYEKLRHIVALCEKSGVHTKFIPDYGNIIPTIPYMEDLQGLPVIHIRRVPLNDPMNAMVKRAVDIVGAIVGIVLFSPIMLIVAVLIKLTSPGPIIFCQERVGLHNRPFKMYKFRSMTVQDPGKEKSRWTTKGDARVTLIGKIIRRTSIDEVPQFFNILIGDMSLVGPRPERPFFVEKFKEEIPRYMIKHQVRPGLTGWAQVNGYRGDTSIIKRIEHDLYYIENWTLGLDFKIMFLTVFKGFINKNAY